MACQASSMNIRRNASESDRIFRSKEWMMQKVHSAYRVLSISEMASTSNTTNREVKRSAGFRSFSRNPKRPFFP